MAGPIERYRALVAKGDIRHDPAQEFAAEQLQLLHNRLSQRRPNGRGLLSRLNGRSRTPAPRGLYLFGDVGRGKSMLMDLFFDQAPVEPRRRVHFHAFMIEVHAAIADWRKLDPRQRSRQPHYVRGAGEDPIRPVARAIAQSARLLCFDEFHVTDIADAMILGRLFEALFAEEVVIVATSNRAPDALYEGGLNRHLFVPFIEMIKARLDVLHLDGPEDYRLARLGGAPVYHTPLGPEADAAMDAAWRRLTDCSRGRPHDLIVQGRTVTVPEAARGVARFAFAALAEQALGAADYLAIAARYHTVLIDHIPMLGAEDQSAARRFVTLIDALYEKRVKLICSAAAEPAALYSEGVGAFEFARTASRLVEMQSADYLALGHCA